MPLSIDGVAYYTASEIIDRLSVTRQTLWRWRSSGKIPHGQRFRDNQVVFTERELKAIERYANKIEPVSAASSQQTLLGAG